MKEFICISIEICIGWTLDEIWIDTESLCKSLNKGRFPSSELSFEQEYAMMLCKSFSIFMHLFWILNFHLQASKDKKPDFYCILL